MNPPTSLGFKKEILELSHQLPLLMNELDKMISHTLKDKDKQIKYIVCKNIIIKLQGLIKDLLEADDNIMTVVSTLRYTLETLITIKFFIKVPKSLYKAFYVVDYIELEIIEDRIKRLEKELQLLERLEKLEKENTIFYANDLMSKINLWQEELKEDRVLLGRKIREASEVTKNKIFNETDKILDENIISIFLKDAKTYGMGYQKHLLETQILPQYEHAKNIIISKIANIESEITQSPLMNQLFDFQGNSGKSIKQILKESPKMSVKAKEVELEDEYNFIYKFTSKMLHFTSYSILTSNSLRGEELLLSYNQFYQYLYKINIAIQQLCELRVKSN